MQLSSPLLQQKLNQVEAPLLFVQSFFRSELRAIKDKQVQYDQKLDKATAQLQQLEELMCYALVILKHTNPLDLAGPSNPVDPSIVTKAPKANTEPLVATIPQPIASSSKKGKKK